MSEQVEARFTVQRELGLHARPAGRFVALAARFQSEVQVARDDRDDEWVSGRSVLSILALGATRETVLRVRAVGPDAKQAVAALGRLIEEPKDPEPGAQPGTVASGGAGAAGRRAERREVRDGG